MTIQATSTEVLSAISGLLDGISMRVIGSDGRAIDRFGTPASDAAEFRAVLPHGSLIGSFPAGDPVREGLVRALVDVVAGRERLESDMDSMSTSSVRLMERAFQLIDALPQLAVGVDDGEIAELAVQACLRAAGVQHVLYFSYSQVLRRFDLVAHVASDAGEAGIVEPLVPQSEGFLGTVLTASGGVRFGEVLGGRRLGEPGSPEHLAKRHILGVPVTVGSDDKRLVLGVLLLVDKSASAYADEEEQESRSQRGVDQLGNEEVQVAEVFAAMLGAVLGARRTAEAGKELTMARAIQQQILPAGALQLPGFDVASEYRACGAVGGDYFDYVPLADGRTLVVVADVSGHNLASGMMMVSARAMLRTMALARSDAASVFADLADAMFDDLVRTERFLTAAGIALRGHDRVVDFIGAGHNDLLVYRAATDHVESVPSEGTILGFLPQPDYSARRIQLAPGDCMLLFTDGIVESMDAGGEMFGEQRLADLLARLAPGRTAQGIVDGVMEGLDRYCGSQVATDDVTAVAIRCVGQGAQQ